MPTVSFIFTTDGCNTKKFGKIQLEYLSDDHEGIDNEIRYKLKGLLDAYRLKLSMSPLTELNIGVIGTTNKFSTKAEKNIFDVLIIEGHYSYYQQCQIPTYYYCMGEEFVEADIVIEYDNCDTNDDDTNDDDDTSK